MKKTLLLLGMLAMSIMTISPAFGQEFWERIYTLPDSCSRTYDIATNIQGDIFVATDKGLYKSSDYTEIWELVWWERNSPCTALDISPNGTICLGRYSPDLLFSNDNGVSWESVEIPRPGSFDVVYRVKYFGNDTLFVLPRCLGHGAHVEGSFDGGRTWACWNMGDWSLDYATDITKTIDNKLYVSLTFMGNKGRGGLYKSDDFGQSWEMVKSLACTGVAASKTSSKVIVSILNGGFKSSKELISNSRVEDDIQIMSIMGCSFFENDLVVANGDTTYLSIDGGNEFVKFSEGPIGGDRIILGKDGRLYSVLRYDCHLVRSITTVEELLSVEEADAECRIELYPNPTKDMVSIEITNADLSMMRILSFTGEEVVNRQLNSGSNTINLPHLSRGIYSVIITTNENTFIKKLIIQ